MFDINCVSIDDTYVDNEKFGISASTPMLHTTLRDVALSALIGSSEKINVDCKGISISPVVTDFEKLIKLINENYDGSTLILSSCGFTMCTVMGASEIKNINIDIDFIKNRKELKTYIESSREKHLNRLYENGIDIPCYDGVEIAPSATIGKGTVILSGTKIGNGVVIGTGSVIGPNTVIEESTIGCYCIIENTKVVKSVIEDNVKIGPYCHIRPNSHIKSGVKIGDFVEVKNSVIGNDTHASHLTYIGDSDVGERVNFGCGTVTSNYDGKNKYRTVIEDDAFIGCNTNLVAPVTVKKGAYTAAGSTITQDVPEGCLAIARSRQSVIEGWTLKKKEK